LKFENEDDTSFVSLKQNKNKEKDRTTRCPPFNIKKKKETWPPTFWANHASSSRVIKVLLFFFFIKIIAFVFILASVFLYNPS
jgi:hypothetical protein